MRIRIKDGERDFCLVLPTNLIFSKGSAWLCRHIGMKYAVRSENEAEAAVFYIPDEALDGLFAELRRIKKRYGSWELVDVESSGGEKVKITL